MADDERPCLHYFELRGGSAIDCWARIQVSADGGRHHHWANGDNFHIEWKSGSEFDGVREEDYHDG